MNFDKWILCRFWAIFNWFLGHLVVTITKVKFRILKRENLKEINQLNAFKTSLAECRTFEILTKLKIE